VTKPRNLVPIEQLTPEIERLLAGSPRVVRELAALTGYSEPAVRIRLEFLLAERRAHRISKGVQGRGKGGFFLWHPGPAPAMADTPRPRHPTSGLNQKTLTEYQIHARRDELVEALFGKPAKAAAPP
jgi:hypothetical protein